MSTSDIKVHLGCGKRYLRGYIHVDLAEYPHIDYGHGVERLPMFEENSVDLIYGSHLLEYFDRAQVIPVLKEWRRVLKPGGTLRLAVPNFEALMEVYGKYGDLDMVLGPLYGRWPIPGSDAIVYHKTIYDFASVKHVLEEAQLGNVRIWDWRKGFVGEHEGFDDYSQAYIPHMDKEHGILISLNVEATK